MGYKKRDFVVGAFEEIGYASYIYDAMPEQLESVLRTLDQMIASWAGIGINLGYPIPSSPDGASLDEETNVPATAYGAIICNLAIRIAPRFGKTVAQETKQIAKKDYDALLVSLAAPISMQYPSGLPAGAGNKPWRRTQQPFLNPPTEQITDGGSSEITFE